MSSSSFFSFSISSTSSGKKMVKNPPFIICQLWFRNYDSRMIWCPKPAIAFTWLSSGPFDFTLNNLFQSSFVLTKMFVIYCFCGLSFSKERKGLFFLTNLGKPPFQKSAVFFNIVQTGGVGVIIPMFKNYVVNIV